MADPQGLLILTTIPLLIFSLILFISNKLKKPQNPPLPPGPYQWPITSLINHLFINPISHISLSNLAQSYGPLMHLRLGSQLLIVGSSPAAAHEILRTNDHVLSSRGVPPGVSLTPSQITKLSFWGDPTSDHWKNIRTVCRTELFSGKKGRRVRLVGTGYNLPGNLKMSKAMEAQASLRAEKVAELVEELRRKEGTAIDVGEMVFATVVNIISNVLFSRDIVVRFGGNEMREIVGGIIEAISAPDVADFYPFLGRLDIQGLRKKHYKWTVKMMALWGTFVEERRDEASGEKLREKDFLDNLVSRGFDDDQINQLFQELFTAGIDTTASTIMRTMMELISNPKSITKLKQELDAAFDHQTALINSCDMEKLVYLQACIKETLRLHPPAPLLLSHRCRETCQVTGYTVPKNAQVLVNVWAIGRDPTVWEDSMEYKPERFLGLSLDFKGNDFELLPFGAGRRICPGISMATKIVPLVVASLEYYFDWSKIEVDEMLRKSSRMKEGVWLVPRARK